MPLPIEKDFRDICDGPVQMFINSTGYFGNEIMNTLSMMVARAFESEYEFICKGVRCENPGEAGAKSMTDKVFLDLRRIQECRDTHRKLAEYSNHLATIAESIFALGWISIPQKPVQYVRDMKEAGDYFGNRVLTSYKGNQLHIDWINDWNACLVALEQYVKKHHCTGFSWNVTGRHGASHAVATTSQVDPPPEVAPPPPPPPPPPGSFKLCAGDAPLVGHEREALERQELERQELLRQLNQGLQITRTLRPVNRDAAGNRGSAPSHALNQIAERTHRPIPRVHPPVFILEGRKWRVEFQLDELALQLTPNDKSESLSMYQCEDSRLELKGKMNAVTIDKCKRCIIVLQSIISSVELIRCEKVEVFCMGNCQSISLDYCDSVQVYLSDASCNCEVITSKCTSVNICRLAQDGDYVEYPVPDQIKSKLSNNKLESTLVEHSM